MKHSFKRFIKTLSEHFTFCFQVERQVHFMTQPVGFWTPDATLQGVSGLPEYPYALEPRMLSRIDAAKYAREAFESGDF